MVSKSTSGTPDSPENVSACFCLEAKLLTGWPPLKYLLLDPGDEGVILEEPRVSKGERRSSECSPMVMVTGRVWWVMGLEDRSRPLTVVHIKLGSVSMIDENTSCPRINKSSGYDLFVAQLDAYLQIQVGNGGGNQTR